MLYTKIKDYKLLQENYKWMHCERGFITVTTVFWCVFHSVPSVSKRKSVLLAIAFASTRAVLLCIYAAGWRLAAFLVTEERIGILEVFR